MSKVPSPAAIMRKHPSSRSFSVTDGQVLVGVVVVDDTGRKSSKRAWVWTADDKFLGEFDGRLAALAALPSPRVRM